MLKILADQTIPFLKGVVETSADVRYAAAREFTPEMVRDVDALIVRSVDKCTRSLLEGSRVRLITTATIGYDHIDTRYCDQVGIRWQNAPGCNARSVGQYVLAVLIATARRRGESLRGKTIGIVGVGHVGKEVARLAEAYGLRVLLNDPPRAAVEGSAGFVSLDEIARLSDIITLHTPLTREGQYPTYHLVDATFLAKLSRKPWLVNASRGAVHETEALIDAYRKGLVSELLIDCWEDEPQISQELLALSSLATPHIAGFSADGKANGTRMCLEEIERFFHIRFDRMEDVCPPAPTIPIIDLSSFEEEDRVAQAVLCCTTLVETDRALRCSPDRFEQVRSAYQHPREFEAYTVVNASPSEAALLRAIGFRVI